MMALELAAEPQHDDHTHLSARKERIEEGLSDHFGRPTHIETLEVRPMGSQSTHPIHRLNLVLGSGESLSAVYKQLSGTDHSRAKGGAREVLTYRRLLRGQRFGAPALYASGYEEAGESSWLLLEDLGETTLKSGELDDWLAAVRLLARMHGRYYGCEDELGALNCLGEQDEEYYRAIAHRARANLEQAGATRALVRFDELMERFETLIPLLISQPRTLVHGDVFSRNMLVQRGHRIRPIDWESASIGLPIWDLARLLCGWQSDKPLFLAVYLQELQRCSAVQVDCRSLEVIFTHCEILDVLWHFGWSVDPCRNNEFVTELLDSVATLWQRLDGRAVR